MFSSPSDYIHFNPDIVAFSLITHYPKWYQKQVRSVKHTDKIRGDLALEFIHKAIDRGYQVVVVDGKSSKTFLSKLRAIPNVHVQRKLTAKRSPKRRLAYKIASKLPSVKVIVATEAEKISLITDCMPQIILPILERKADIVIPKREDTLFRATYPSYMYESEIEGNLLYNQNLRLYGLLSSQEDLDMFFGPRVFQNDSKIVKLFMKRHIFHMKHLQLPKDYFQPEELSNASYFPIIEALKRKLQVVSVTVPFSYPVTQKENEEKGAREFFIEKRKSQKLTLLVELMYFLQYIKKYRD